MKTNKYYSRMTSLPLFMKFYLLRFHSFGKSSSKKGTQAKKSLQYNGQEKYGSESK